MVRYKKNGKIYALKSIRKAHVVKNKKVRDSRALPPLTLLGNHHRDLVPRYHFAAPNHLR